MMTQELFFCGFGDKVEFGVGPVLDPLLVWLGSALAPVLAEDLGQVENRSTGDFSTSMWLVVYSADFLSHAQKLGLIGALRRLGRISGVVLVSEHLQPDDLALIAETCGDRQVELDLDLSRCEPRWVERDLALERGTPKELVLGALRMVLPFALARSARKLLQVCRSATDSCVAK